VIKSGGTGSAAGQGRRGVRENSADPNNFSFLAPCSSLYIHIPFCAGACDYCDFYSVPVSPEDRRIGLFIEALLREAAEVLRRYGVRQVPTVFIGGGTPSVLGARGVRRLLEGLRALLPEAPEELTVEANPESADRPFLEACREGGVTRISLGVQTFYEASRRAVHRVGEGRLLPERLHLVPELFGENFSADLMTGLPFQDEKIVGDDIERLLSRRPGHVSLYSLTVEEGTALARRPRSFLSSPDEAARLWIRGRDLLEAAGYEQYEVSNFSLPGKRCRHNIRYWQMENWLGLGPAASGTVIDDETGTGRRYTVRSDVDAWLGAQNSGGLTTGPEGAGPAFRTEEYLDRSTLMKETLLMGFRYIDGPDPDLFYRRFGSPLEEAIPRTLGAWQDRGMLRRDRTALTREGLLFLNPFLIDAFGEMG
jgi:oxygen-independent coproporphyrinogen-3 oxidase